MEIRVASLEAMHELGRRLGAAAFAGCVIALEGDLGAGKTELVRGIAQGLCTKSEICSPTYALIHEHEQGRLPLYHIDLYRLEESATMDLGLEEYIYGEGVCAIEWAQRSPSLLPGERLDVCIRKESGEARVLELFAGGKKYQKMLEALDA